jgi:hypothetical protein
LNGNDSSIGKPRGFMESSSFDQARFPCRVTPQCFRLAKWRADLHRTAIGPSNHPRYPALPTEIMTRILVKSSRVRSALLILSVRERSNRAMNCGLSWVNQICSRTCGVGIRLYVAGWGCCCVSSAGLQSRSGGRQGGLRVRIWFVGWGICFV